MPKYPSVPEVAKRIKDSADRRTQMFARAIPVVIEKKDADLAAANVRRSASINLCAAMVYERHDKDHVTARRYFASCANLVDVLEEMTRKGLGATPWSGLFVLYGSLISGQFDKAMRVANWTISCPPIAEDSGDQHDPIAMLSAYAVLDMREKFHDYRSERFDRSWHSKHPFFGPLSVYLDLWQAVLGREQHSFDAAMIRREDHMVRLSKQKGEGRLEFGGGQESNYIIDFMGLGCAIAARRVGMKCDVDTIYLPNALVEAAAKNPAG